MDRSQTISLAQTDGNEPQPISISELNGQIRERLTGQFRDIWVVGEITDLSRPRSGHCYFSLKDGTGQINAVLWRGTAEQIGFALQDGMEVICRGGIDVYVPRGTYQLIVKQLRRQGEGAQQAALRALQARLASEGLFDSGRKRPLPAFARRIAVVTSPSGAALRDFVEVARRRWHAIQIVVVPTRVQGAECGAEIADAVRKAIRLAPQLDAILVTRGGGSVEDLNGFNDERVVRAMADSPIPIVSAVGHEIDVTLADLVADVRALTPSEAGERLIPDVREIQDRLLDLRQRIRSLTARRCQLARTQLGQLAMNRVLQDPLSLLRDRVRTLDELARRGSQAVAQRIERHQHALARMAGQLDSLSPLQVLARGYSLTQDRHGKIVRTAESIELGDPLTIRLHQGILSVTVNEKPASIHE